MWPCDGSQFTYSALDAKGVERLSTRDCVHDWLGECTAAQDAEVRPLSDDVTDFAGVIAERGAWEERGE